MDLALKGARVLVTGGAAGIGLATARAFAAADGRVMICDLTDEALAEVGKSDPGLVPVKADISDRGDVDRMFEAAERELGGLDVLVNNAGISGPMGPVESLEPDDWNKVFAVNMTGTFQVTRRAVPMLKSAGGGSIINISSAAGHLPYAWRTPYSSSKWALVGFSLSLALELGPDKIRVNAIMPGIVTGERRDRNSRVRAKLAGITPEELEERRLSRVAMLKPVDPEEIADISVFLASRLGRSISGQTIGVDGYIQALSGPGGR